MNHRETWKRLALGAPLLLLLAGGTSLASTYFDVAVGMKINEDTRIFLNVTNEVWQPAVAASFIHECRNPADDFPVVAFLAFHSHRHPNVILRLRSEGHPWHEIFYRLHVNPSVLFVGIDRDPGPPYGKAWGHWRKSHRARTRERFLFSDRDVVGLVKVQTISRHFGMSPLDVISAHRQGRRAEAFAAHRWREKHRSQTWAEGHGAGKGHGKGRDDGDDRSKKSSHGKKKSQKDKGRR